MAAGYNQLILRWKDVNGLYCTNFFCTQNQDEFSDSGLLDLCDAAIAITNCGLVFAQFVQTVQFGRTPTSGTYGTVYDRAMFLSNTSDPIRYGQMQIPGPKDTIFNSDNLTIDLSNPDVSAFTTAAIGQLALPVGNNLAGVYSGRRTRVRTNQA
jgi:hypothetical protein